MVIPIVHRKAPDAAIQSYDFVDIMNGTGQVLLYAGVCRKYNDAGSYVDTYVLSNTTWYGDTTRYDWGSSSKANWTSIGDVKTFEVIINRQIILQGYAIVNVSLYSSDANVNIRPRVTIAKYSNGVETTIGYEDGNVAANNYTTSAIRINCTTTPFTRFKPGDILRLKIDVMEKSTVSTGDTIHFAVDPMGRTGTWSASYPTTLKFLLPVRIDN